MNDEDVQTAIAEVVLGQQAEEFLASDIGRYLLGKAKQEEEEAKEAMCSVHPADRDAISALQNSAWRAKTFRSWLVELIENGRNSESALNAMAAEGGLEEQ